MPHTPRIALYSHDTMGMGHMRRNLLLAQEIAASEQEPSVLLIGGSREITRFGVPRGTDLISLPALYKDSHSRYHARSLGVSVDEVISIRSRVIVAALASFRPDIFIVDNVPRGAQGELDAALEFLHREGRTRCVLGLRDVLDAPDTVRQEWERAGNIAAVRRYFGQVWVYGDRGVVDVAREYGLPADLEDRIHYVGYLDQRRRAGSGQALAPDDRRMVSCFVGGGQDGLPLASAFIEAGGALPPAWRPVLVTGPMMSSAGRGQVMAVAAANPGVEVHEFVDDPAALLRQSEAVITMGGYNTVCDVLSTGLRALVVPRVRPRTEQLIRATRLAARGLLDVLHPDDLSPDALRRWLCGPVPTRTRHPVHLHSGPALRALVHDLLQSPAPAPLSAFGTVRHAS